MSLVEDIKEWFGGENKWPGDLPHEVRNCVLVKDEITDTTRWGIVHEAVFLRKTESGGYSGRMWEEVEYVMVDYQEPATEMQEWDSFNEPDVYEVAPVEVTITKYVKIDK